MRTEARLAVAEDTDAFSGKLLRGCGNIFDLITKMMDAASRMACEKLRYR